MDLANTLIRTVARAFYETRHILVIDALFIHSVLHAEDLAFLLGMQQKDLRKLCAKLREDRLIGVSTRAEIRDGSTRPVNREYYFIPLHPVVDAIKYKVSKLTSTIKLQYTPSQERKEYICLRCGAEWTELDVLSLYSDEGFECQNCGAILERTEDVKGSEGIDRTGHEKNSKLMAQLDKMLKLLKQIDSVEIPPNDFDTAWDHKVDVIRNQHTNPTRAAIVVPSKKQEAVRGTLKTDAGALEISLTSTEEKTAAEQKEEAARKAALEKQNALPVWHTHSTVSTTAGNVGIVKSETDIKIKPEIKGEEDQKPNLADLDDKVAAYYAEMEREKALQAQEDASSPEEDSDEFEEEFEDVGGVSASDTASQTVGSLPGGPTSAPAGIKREFDTDSGSSAPQTTTGTPSTPADEGPAAKRIKTEPEIKKEESDEDDEEFEDV
ncbi:putative transcription factor TFIIE complex alpha subunit [Aspergillus lucknowensis]|uniref:TFIIE alpha subunit-domain-containing protein n=1 Tax=Aspergillus lucknowensis TaxID=176173 RepID=A0ABR4M7V6_9EURO